MFKKVISGIMSLTLAASVAVISASAASKGDVDGSGKIDIEDAVSVINHINGVKALSGSSLTAADVNGSGNVDIEDAVAIINHVNGVSAIGGGGGSTTTGGKLESLRKKYGGDYTIKLKNSAKGIEQTYIVSGNTFYTETKYDGTLNRFEVCGSDGVDYWVSVSDKTYFKVNLSTVPADCDPIGKLGVKYVKAESKGGMTYEYYTAVDYTFEGSGKIVYGFDSSSNLKTIEFRPDSSSETGITYDVVSVAKADKSKITKPNLSGYSEYTPGY